MIGLVNGSVQTCPSSPNCVSTSEKETDTQHYISPYKYTKGIEDTKKDIKDIIKKKGWEIVSTNDSTNYWHVVVKTTFFRFRDDFEIHINQTSSLIEFRSASRVGHSDFGVNRKRVNDFKDRLSKKFK